MFLVLYRTMHYCSWGTDANLASENKNFELSVNSSDVI